VEGSAAVLGLADQIALGSQACPKKAADCGFVIDDEHIERGGFADHAAISRMGLRSAGSGKAIVKTAPARSRRLPAVIVPLMASTNPLQMARPRPVPTRRLSATRTR